MPATATKAQPKAAVLPATNEPPKARRTREIIWNAIVEKRELTLEEAAEINKAFAGDQVAAITWLTQKFAEDVSVGKTVESFRPMLQNLLDGGAAGAIYNVAKHRYDLQMAFEQTAWHKRKVELCKIRDDAAAELAKVEADEDAPPLKVKKRLQTYEESLKAVSDHVNGNAPELVAFRRAMEETAEPTFPTCQWWAFAI